MPGRTTAFPLLAAARLVAGGCIRYPRLLVADLVIVADSRRQDGSRAVPVSGGHLCGMGNTSYRILWTDPWVQPRFDIFRECGNSGSPNRTMGREETKTLTNRRLRHVFECGNSVLRWMRPSNDAILVSIPMASPCGPPSAQREASALSASVPSHRGVQGQCAASARPAPPISVAVVRPLEMNFHPVVNPRNSRGETAAKGHQRQGLTPTDEEV